MLQASADKTYRIRLNFFSGNHHIYGYRRRALYGSILCALESNRSSSYVDRNKTFSRSSDKYNTTSTCSTFREENCWKQTIIWISTMENTNSGHFSLSTKICWFFKFFEVDGKKICSNITCFGWTRLLLSHNIQSYNNMYFENANSKSETKL